MRADVVAGELMGAAKPHLHGLADTRLSGQQAVSVLVSLVVEAEGLGGPDAVRAANTALVRRHGAVRDRSVRQHEQVFRELCELIERYTEGNGITDASVAQTVRIICAGRGKRNKKNTPSEEVWRML